MAANKDNTRLASLVDKDGEDAITSIHSGNNGDRLLEKQKSKAVVWSVLVINPI